MKRFNKAKTKILNFSDKSIIHYSLVMLIIMLALVSRLQFFYQGDMLFLIDQARDMMLVKEIAVNYKVTLIGARAGFGGLFHGPLWLYMLVPTFLIFHGNPFWTLVPIFVLVSISIVIAGYIIGRVLYGKRIGLLLMALLANSAILNHMVPLTTNAHIMPLIFIIYLLSIFNYLRGNSKWLILTGFCIGLGFQFEAAFGVFFLPGLLFALLLRRKIPSIGIVIAGIAGFLFLVSNFILFELRHQFIMTSSALKLFHGHNDPIKGYEQYASYWFRIEDHVIGFIKSFNLPFPQASTVTLLAALVIVSAAAIILINDWVKKKRTHQFVNEFIYLLSFTIMFYALFTLYPYPLWEHYIFPVTISSALLIVLSFRVVGRFLAGQLVIGALLIYIFFFAMSNLANTYIHSSSLSTFDGSLKNQEAAVEWIYNDSHGKDINYLTYTPGALTYNTDYLMWWRGQSSNQLSSNQKATTTYIIAFPSSQGAYEFWKENVIHTQGKILSSKTFSGGIRVEKLAIRPLEPAVDPNYFVNLTFR